MTVVLWVCGAAFGSAAALAVWRMNHGPRMLDRMIAVDVLIAAVVGALGLEAAVNRQRPPCPFSWSSPSWGSSAQSASPASPAARLGHRFPSRRRTAVTWDTAFDIASACCLVGERCWGWPRRSAWSVPRPAEPHACSDEAAGSRSAARRARRGCACAIGAVGMLVLVAAMQLLTTPVAAHMVGRAAYRTGQVREDLLLTDELMTALDPDDTGAA